MLGFLPLASGPLSSIDVFPPHATIIAAISIVSGEAFGVTSVATFDLTVFQVFFLPRERKTVWKLSNVDD